MKMCVRCAFDMHAHLRYLRVITGGGKQHADMTCNRGLEDASDSRKDGEPESGTSFARFQIKASCWKRSSDAKIGHSSGVLGAVFADEVHILG